MPRIIVFKCDEPECTEIFEINLSKLERLGKKIEIPEDWDIQHVFGFNAQEEKVFCPKHNKNIEAQRRFKEFQHQMRLELEKNHPVPKGGLLPSRCPRCETRYGEH